MKWMRVSAFMEVRMKADLDAYRKLIDRLAQSEISQAQAKILLKLADDLQDLRDDNLALRGELLWLQDRCE